MTYINKSASKIGTIEFENGITNTLYIGFNSNTNEAIFWQSPSNGRPSRLTGKNIRKILLELVDVLNGGEGKWVGFRNKNLIDYLVKEYDLENRLT